MSSRTKGGCSWEPLSPPDAQLPPCSSWRPRDNTWTNLLASLLPYHNWHNPNISQPSKSCLSNSCLSCCVFSSRLVSKSAWSCRNFSLSAARSHAAGSSGFRKPAEWWWFMIMKSSYTATNVSNVSRFFGASGAWISQCLSRVDDLNQWSKTSSYFWVASIVGPWSYNFHTFTTTFHTITFCDSSFLMFSLQFLQLFLLLHLSANRLS